jgi:hypothetical protein
VTLALVQRAFVPIPEVEKQVLGGKNKKKFRFHVQFPAAQALIGCN